MWVVSEEEIYYYRFANLLNTIIKHFLYGSRFIHQYDWEPVIYKIVKLEKIPTNTINTLS